MQRALLIPVPLSSLSSFEFGWLGHAHANRRLLKSGSNQVLNRDLHS